MMCLEIRKKNHPCISISPLVNCCSVCKITCTVKIRHCKFASFHKFKYAGVFNLKVCMIIKHSSMCKIILVNDFVFVTPLPLLTVLIAILLKETTLKGGEGGGQCYISQMHVKQIFWVKNAGFSLECLNIFATSCSWLCRESQGI